MSPAAIFGGVFLLAAIYCGLDPLHHRPTYGFPNFVTHRIEMDPWSEIPFAKDPHNRLQRSEIRFLNQVQGPESVAFDPPGRGPYTGVADGRILYWNGTDWTDFAYTSSNRSKCQPKPLLIDYLKYEDICGRPLGIRFHKQTGDMYIADAYHGLMKVGPEGGLATPLTREADGVSMRFTNDVDVDVNGNVYFTDSSNNYQRRNFMQALFSGDNSGRVLKYDPVANETSVLMRNLQLPNGISLCKDGSSLVFAEGTLGRLRRYWLRGEKAGTSELVAILPGHPDNIRVNEKGEIWVAMHYRRTLYSHILGLYPKLRDLIFMLPIKASYHHKLYSGGRLHGMVAKYSPDGELLEVLEDREGKVVRAASEVEEKDGKLWIGSILTSFIAVYDLESS